MIWRWRDDTNGWRRRFAILPICLRDGPNRELVWLQWIWVKDYGDARLVSTTDPLPAAIRSGDEG